MKNNLSRHLAYVRRGGEVLVLDRETPVALLVPFARAEHRGRPPAGDLAADERLAGMERTGVITRGDPSSVREWLDTHRPAALPRGGGSLLRALLDLRDEDAR